MAKPIFHQQPAFFGQALLILLPLAVLAAVSAFSLRQDRILAEHEAAERSQSIADDLLPKIWSEVTATNHLGGAETYAFTVDAEGHLLSPPPLAPVPVPCPLDLASLTPAQRQAWQTAQLTEAEARDSGSKAAK